MTLRLPAFIAALLSIIFLPYWIYLPMLMAFILLFPAYWEAIFFGFLVDILYGNGVSVSRVFSMVSFWALVAVIASLPVRERLRIHI